MADEPTPLERDVKVPNLFYVDSDIEDLKTASVDYLNGGIYLDGGHSLEHAEGGLLFTADGGFEETSFMIFISRADVLRLLGD